MSEPNVNLNGQPGESFFFFIFIFIFFNLRNFYIVLLNFFIHLIHLGWNDRSYGYHGDDGLKFISNGHRGYDYGPLYTTNDTIGCCVNFFNNTCFYTKNGIHLGKKILLFF
jgi:hypothetical protein